jgi:O-antigen/teichoic acid export membrane protein
MAKWVPGAAVFGLLCLLIIPAPGIWGVLIGALCVLAIVVSLSVLLLDRIATAILAWRARVRAKRPSRRRAVHAGSGISRKR